MNQALDTLNMSVIAVPGFMKVWYLYIRVLC